MKYQIYLNKTTSETIEKMANHDGVKPCTYIKQMIESLISITLATLKATEMEAEKYGPKRNANEQDQ